MVPVGSVSSSIHEPCNSVATKSPMLVRDRTSSSLGPRLSPQSLGTRLGVVVVMVGGK